MAVDKSGTKVSDDDDSAVDETDLDDEATVAAGEVEDDFDDDIEAPDQRRLSTVSRPSGRQRLVKYVTIAILTVATVVVLTVVVDIVRNPPGKSASPSANKSPSAPAVATFSDAADHFQLNYPRSWAVQKKNLGAGVKLLTTFSPDGLDLMEVRVVPIAATVDTTNEADIKSVTDSIISGTNVTVLEQRAITVDGLLGYDYFYSFPSSGTTLIHSHVFVFPPHEMVSLVFQTTQADFPDASSNISLVLSSFKHI